MQKECHVQDLKLSDWGIQKNDLSKMVQNARETMGDLFRLDPRPLRDEEILDIYEKSYK